MRIFYSWQLDSQAKYGKNLIHEALSGAVDDLTAEHSLKSNSVSIDHDTRDVLGSPHIVKVIQDKINACDVFIADVSLTATVNTPKEDQTYKKHFNSNVAVELGYALGVHDDSAIVKVMNTFHGTPQELPFDIRDRFPLDYYASPSLSKEELKKVRADLRNNFKTILHAHFMQYNKPTATEELVFPRTESTFTKAAYWESNEELFKTPDGEFFKYDNNGLPLFYLRISPKHATDPLRNTELKNMMRGIKPLFIENTYRSERNKYGYVTRFENSEFDNKMTSTQVFKNREIWGVAAGLYTVDDNDQRMCIPSESAEEFFRISLREYAEFACEKLKYPDNLATIEAGLVNLNQGNTYLAGKLAVKGRYSTAPDTTLQSEVFLISDLNLDNDENIRLFHEEFWTLLYDGAGLEYSIR